MTGLPNQSVITWIVYACADIRAKRNSSPTVFSDVIEVSQLAVHHLSAVVLKERHPPDPVACDDTCLEPIM